MSPEPVLPVFWGATDLKTFQRLSEVTSIEQLKALEQNIGEARAKPEKANKMGRFLTNYFQSLNKKRSKRIVPRWLCAPKVLWTFPGDGVYNPEDRIVRIEISQLFTAFLLDHYQIVRRRRVLELDLADELGENDSHQ